MSTVIKAKINKMLDKAEDPSETLEYSYAKQMELLQNVKKGIADVVTAKKRLQLQQQKLEQQVVKLDTQARQAMAAGKEDLARLALERKQLAQTELQSLDQQVTELEAQQQRLTDNEAKLRKFAASTELFFPGGELPEVGSVFRNPDLARTYARIGREGLEPFYEGELAGYWGGGPGRDLNLAGSWGKDQLPPVPPKRFGVSVHVAKVLTVENGGHRRLRVQTYVDDGESVPSLVPVYPSADYHEREAWVLPDTRPRYHGNQSKSRQDKTRHETRQAER